MVTKDGWLESEYYYKDRKILVKSRKGNGMRAHVFHKLSQDKVEFTLRYHFVKPSELLDLCKRKINEKEMKRYTFTAKVKDEKPFHPKGFYYQKNHIILVGDVDAGHTIRRQEHVGDVEIKIEQHDE